MGVNFCFRFVVFLSNRWTTYGIDIVGILRRNYRLEVVLKLLWTPLVIAVFYLLPTSDISNDMIPLKTCSPVVPFYMQNLLSVNFVYCSRSGVGNLFRWKSHGSLILKMAFHKSHTVGHWCRMGPQNHLIRYKLSNSGYMITKDDTSDSFGRPFWRYSLYFNALKKSAKICIRAREPYAVLKRGIRGSRAEGA